jgi:PhnB protein
MPVQPIPGEFRGATPMLAIRGAAEAIEFYKRAFGAVEVMRLNDPQGMVAHAEIKIGGALVMLAEEHPDYNRSPQTLGGTSVVVMIYVEDVDAVFQRAIDAGAKVVFPLRDQFYGDRSGRLEDPFGHMWIFSTHIDDVPAEEMQRRFDALMQEAG